MRRDLLRWQYQGYATFHRTRTNLLIHILAVPVFIGATVGLIVSAVAASWAGLGVSGGLLALAFAAQGWGHKREPTPSIPFDGPSDMASRIFVEQFVTFPRFVTSGGWVAALRGSTRGRQELPTPPPRAD